MIETTGYHRGDLSVEPWTDESGRLSIYIMDACECTDEDGDTLVTDAGVELSAEDRLATAALCLRDQPFGFTWDDVDNLRDLADWLARVPVEAFDNDEVRSRHKEGNDGLRELAGRIAALLPPREGG